jgi:GNAT superfamily N-acetyltransferase
MCSTSVQVDYLGNQRRFLPMLLDAMYEHWRLLLHAMGKSRDDFAESLQDRCRIGSLPTALVAYEGDQVIGTCALKPQDLDIRQQLSPWLGGMFVLPEYRGRGLGALLVSKTVAEARKLGLAQLYLWTPASERLYARHGWAVVERTRYHDLQICIMHQRL